MLRCLDIFIFFFRDFSHSAYLKRNSRKLQLTSDLNKFTFGFNWIRGAKGKNYLLSVKLKFRWFHNLIKTQKKILNETLKRFKRETETEARDCASDFSGMLLLPANDSSASNMVFSKVRSWSDVNEREKNNNNPVKSEILRTPSRCTLIYRSSFISLESFCLECNLFGVSNLQICISPSDFHEILFLPSFVFHLLYPSSNKWSFSISFG